MLMVHALRSFFKRREQISVGLAIHFLLFLKLIAISILVSANTRGGMERMAAANATEMKNFIMSAMIFFRKRVQPGIMTASHIRGKTPIQFITEIDVGIEAQPGDSAGDRDACVEAALAEESAE